MSTTCAAVTLAAVSICLSIAHMVTGGDRSLVAAAFLMACVATAIVVAKLLRAAG